MAKGNKKARKVLTALKRAVAEVLTAVLSGVLTEIVIHLLFG